MVIGHINLEKSCNESFEHFLGLVDALQLQVATQYVVVRSRALAKRLDLLDNVSVGPLARSSVTAACLMPHVDVVHIHNSSARQAGLILKLTRSIPFVLTDSSPESQNRNPISQSVYKRASGLIPYSGKGSGNRSDSDADIGEHLRIYRQAADTLSVPTMLL